MIMKVVSISILCLLKVAVSIDDVFSSNTDYCDASTWDFTQGITFNSQSSSIECMRLNNAQTWKTYSNLGDTSLTDYSVEFTFKNGNHESAFIYVYLRES